MWSKKVSVKPTDRGEGKKKEKVVFVASGLLLPLCD